MTRQSVILICFLLASPHVGAQDPADRLKKVVLPGEVRQATGRLAAVADLVRRSKWAEALDEYQRLISEAGDDLVPLEEGGALGSQRSIQIRRLCHLRLAALPPAALRMYRDRVEVQAEKWLEQGRADRDVRALRRVVDEAFCSRAGAQALDLLGDLAFEQGNFEEALNWWRMLALPADVPADRQGFQLVCPDPAIDLARVRAKQILARLFQGDLEQAEVELQAFRRLHPGSAGQLAGRKGNYAETVQAFLDQTRAASFPETQDWPTFGGAAARNRPLPAAPPRRLWADGPAWRVRLDTGQIIKSHGAPEEKPASARSPSRFAVHPIIVGDKVFVADARQVLGFHLLTGRLLFRYELKRAEPRGELEVPAVRGLSDPEERHTLTSSEDRVYARLGASLLGLGKDGSKTKAGASYLVCLDLQRDGPQGPALAGQSRERWRVQASGAPGVPTVLEGAPLVHNGCVYIAVTSLVGSRTQTAIACHDAATGTARWRQEICDSPEYEEQPALRARQHLLTLAGAQVVYCSHAGAIVALDSLTGKRAWAVRYPGRGAKAGDGDAVARDPAPCVYDGGRLFAAPADSDRVLCFDPPTGRVLWERDGMGVVQLLGAAHGRLIFTTPSGIRALNAATGGDQGGWAQPDEGKLPGLGRGLLAGGWVFWPTQDSRLPLRALSQEHGSQQRGEEAFEPTQLRNLVPGNFAAGGGCLVVAGAEELVGYVPPERFLKQHQQDAARPNAPASAYYQLARAEAGTGLYAQALDHYARAERTSNGVLPAGRSIAALARAGRVALLAELHRAKATAALLAQLTGNQVPVAWGLPALTLLGDLWTRAGRPKQAFEIWQAMLRDPELRKLPVTGADGIPRRAADLAAARIKELLKVHGTAALGGRPPDEVIVERLATKNIRPGAPSGLASQGLSELALPVLRIWKVPAGRLVVPVRNALAPAAGEDVFFVSGAEVSCHDAATGMVRWRRSLSFAPAWIGAHADTILVAGPAYVQSLRLADGHPVWEFMMPAPEDDDGQGHGPLSGFQLTTSHLCFFLGSRCLVAVNVDDGQVAWSFWAPGARVRPLAGGGRFHRHYHAGESWVVLQTTGGTRLILASATGQKLHEAPTATSPWPQPPLLLHANHLALVEDAWHVALLDLATGKSTWTYQPREPTCLTGEPPQLFGNEDVLCLLVPLNFGYQLERIDPASGKHLWPDAPRISRTAFAGKTAAFDPTTLYYCVDQVLHARALADGKRLWADSLPAPAGPWQVVSTGPAVAVYPLAALAAVWNRASRVPCTIPVGFSQVAMPVPRCSTTLSEGAPGFRVLLYDPRAGQLLQRLSFTTVQPWAGLQFFKRRLVVGTEGRAWGLAAGSD